MQVRLTQPVVIKGAVWQAGKVIDIEKSLAEDLEYMGKARRLEHEWADEIKKRPPTPINDVLVFVPVYRLEPETVAAVHALEWDGALTIVFQRDNPHKEGRRNILHQYRRGRELFMAGSYDAMLVIESDIIPPPDTLKKLAALNTDCAYGVYRFRQSDVINIFEKYPGKPRNVGESLSVKPHLLARALSKGIYPCSGAGLGVILIKRHVLELIDFRLEESADCDTYFTRDVMAAGFEQLADMSIICGHKDKDGTIHYPNLTL